MGTTSISAEDVVTVRFDNTSQFGDFVGVRLAITASDAAAPDTNLMH